MLTDVIDEFSSLKQTGSVDAYQARFEELRTHMRIVNPSLNEMHFISNFVKGLKLEIKPLVRVANASSLMDAYEIFKLHEESFNAQNKQPRTTFSYPKHVQPKPPFNCTKKYPNQPLKL